MVQILELIRGDHDFIMSLLDDLADNPESRDIRCITLRRELSGHMYAEEATLYTRLRDVVPEEIRKLTREHIDISDALAHIETIPLSDEAWVPALDDLRDLVEAHFAAEEGEAFARAEHHLSRSDLFDLSEAFQREKEAAARYAVM
jgi:hemerythrin superfamily protein